MEKITQEAFQKKTDAQLKKWEAQLVALKGRAKAAIREEKVELHGQVAELSMLHGSARQHLAEFRAAAGSAWMPITEAIQETWARLSAGIDSMWAKVV